MKITVTDRRFFPTLSRWVEAGETVEVGGPVDKVSAAKKAVKVLDSTPVNPVANEVVDNGNSEE